MVGLAGSNVGAHGRHLNAKGRIGCAGSGQDRDGGGGAAARLDREGARVDVDGAGTAVCLERTDSEIAGGKGNRNVGERVRGTDDDSDIVIRALKRRRCRARVEHGSGVVVDDGKKRTKQRSQQGQVAESAQHVIIAHRGRKNRQAGRHCHRVACVESLVVGIKVGRGNGRAGARGRRKVEGRVGAKVTA